MEAIKIDLHADTLRKITRIALPSPVLSKLIARKIPQEAKIAKTRLAKSLAAGKWANGKPVKYYPISRGGVVNIIELKPPKGVDYEHNRGLAFYDAAVEACWITIWTNFGPSFWSLQRAYRVFPVHWILPHDRPPGRGAL